MGQLSLVCQEVSCYVYSTLYYLHSLFSINSLSSEILCVWKFFSKPHTDHNNYLRLDGPEGPPLLVPNIKGPQSVQSLSHVRLFATPWTAAHQASLSITNSQSFLKLMSIESVMPSNHFILCRPLLLMPSIFPSFRVFSNESVLCIRWPKYRSFSVYTFKVYRHRKVTGFFAKAPMMTYHR